MGDESSSSTSATSSSTDGERLLDPMAEWAGHDEEELRVSNVGRVKDMAFMVFLATVYGLAASGAAQEPLPEPSLWRAVAECVLAGGMLMELFVDTFLYPCATKDLECFALNRIAGKAHFLTTWILYCQSIEMVASAAGELLLLAGMPWPALLTASYRLAVAAATLGIMLTLLFLKFNYFEEKWRTEIAGVWEQRGYNFFTLMLLGHVPSLPVAVLDVALVRDGRFLALCNLSLLQNMGLLFAFAAVWYTLIHVLWWATDYKCWPYPFLHEFGTCAKRLAFFVAVFVALVLVMLPLQFLAGGLNW